MSYELGIDFASVDENTETPFAQAKSDGAGFVIVRASWGTWADPTPASAAAAVRAAKLVYGAYIGPKIVVGQSAAAQVSTFAASAQLQRGVDLAPVIDIEFPSKISGTGMTRAQIATWLGELVAAVKQTFGCLPIVYSSQRVLDTDDVDTLDGAADPQLVGCPLWLSRYPYAYDQPAQTSPSVLASLAPPPVPTSLGDADGWWIHQYQGDARDFAGFNQVDCNRFNLASSTTTGTRRAWLCARLGIPSDTTPAELDAAIRSFQRAHSLGVDGIVGPQTFAALSWQNY